MRVSKTVANIVDIVTNMISVNYIKCKTFYFSLEEFHEIINILNINFCKSNIITDDSGLGENYSVHMIIYNLKDKVKNKSYVIDSNENTLKDVTPNDCIIRLICKKDGNSVNMKFYSVDKSIFIEVIRNDKLLSILKK